VAAAAAGKEESANAVRPTLTPYAYTPASQGTHIPAPHAQAPQPHPLRPPFLLNHLLLWCHAQRWLCMLLLILWGVVGFLVPILLCMHGPLELLIGSHSNRMGP
jgi:hypothetical protein